ncbi:glycosyltransferase [Hyunsoonleella sp. 2307UL5-6]|uniref:glycosyltransferase n=1 Tax=Hyunsoonleella sp. 2307UL5-6 TaxID=3384768 RepID=UPI0039BC6324
MAHIAICTSKLKGLLYASFELARRLESEGHSITFLCPIDVKNLIENEGFKFLEVPPIKFWYKPNAVKKNSWKERFKTHFTSRDLGFETLKKELHIPVYIETLKKIKPDLVICDMQLHEIIFAAYGLKIPLKLLSPWFCMRKIAGLPSIKSPIIPIKNSIKSTIEIEKYWLKLKAKIYLRYISDILTFRNYRRSILKKYAKSVGFNTKHLILRNFPSHFIYNKLPILTLTLKEMEFPHKNPDNLIYLGLMVYQNRIDANYPENDRFRLNQLIEAKIKDNKKLIYCGMGSMEKGDLPFLNKLLEAVGNNSEWILIVSLGGLLTKNELYTIPDNVQLFNWVSQPELLKHVDCCINHAGINTINECIINKTPMLIYSWHRVDKDGTAARMKYYKIALVREKENDTPEDIKTAITTLLTKENMYSQNLEKFYKIQKEYQAKKLTPVLGINA